MQPSPAPPPIRRISRIGVLALALGLLALVALMAGWPAKPRTDRAPIRIGVLHSLTGTMAVSERPLAAAAQMAVAEINADGGLLGRRVEIVTADGRSDPAVFAAEAERLITHAHVDALFACWTSACRQAVRPVVEHHDSLMFYPLQYEGFEQSPNIIYTGPAPNQQIVPGTRWALRQFGTKVFLVGSDYIFPRTANLIIRDLVGTAGGAVLGERYLPLGSSDVGAIVDEIARLKPDIVFNTLNGGTNAAFFAAMIEAGLADQPLMSFSLAEPEMQAWGGGRFSRHFAVWDYFQSTATPANAAFVAAFKARQGANAVTSAPIVSAYLGVKLWANAVREAGSADPPHVNGGTLLRQSVAGPVGVVAIDAGTRHLWEKVRIGRALPDGQFEEVFSSADPLRPAPWPVYRSREEWQALLGIPP